MYYVTKSWYNAINIFQFEHKIFLLNFALDKLALKQHVQHISSLVKFYIILKCKKYVKVFI